MKKQIKITTDSYVSDLIGQRIRAHIAYVTPRILGEKKQTQFIKAMVRAQQAMFVDNLPPRFDLDEGSQLAKALVEDILNQTQKRFTESHPRSFYMEKL